MDFESSYYEFKGPAEKLLNGLTPITPVTINRKTGPRWVDAEYRSARAERRKLERRWRKSKSEADHQHYLTQRNFCAQLSVTKQKRFFCSTIQSSRKRNTFGMPTGRNRIFKHLHNKR